MGRVYSLITLYNPDESVVKKVNKSRLKLKRLFCVTTAIEIIVRCSSV